MKIGACAALLMTTATASAQISSTARLQEYGAHIAPRSPQYLVEKGCEIDVEIRGGLALVEQRHRLANESPSAVGAILGTLLPTQGVVTGFGVREGNSLNMAIAVADVPAPESSHDFPDPALLVAREDGFLMVVQPFAARTETTLVARYSAPVDVRGGALHVVLPARAGLMPCGGTLRASAGPGAAVADLLVDGTAAKRFTLGDNPVRLSARLSFTGEQPLVWSQTQKLREGMANLVTVVTPPARAAGGHRRALFVLDGSRSMELVGKARVKQAVHAIAAVLPPETPIDAIVFDRSAKRVLGSFTAAAPSSLAAIDKAIDLHVAQNGTDLTGALSLAKNAIVDGNREATLVVVVSDGVLGQVAGTSLVSALDAQISTVDVLALAIAPSRTRAPDMDALRAPSSVLGGTALEVGAAQLDDALLSVSEWLRPAWHDVTLAGFDVPGTLAAGNGFVITSVDTKAVLPTLTARREKAISVKARPMAATPVAPTVLRAANAHDPSIPYVTDTNAFVVLSSSKDKRTAARVQFARAGGKYLRVVAVDDPDDVYTLFTAAAAPVIATGGPSAIDASTLTRLFREQLQPKAYACYQRALGTNSKLAGTVRFTFILGRGEVTRVDVYGIGDAALDACLTEAAYSLTVPYPDLAVNIDDQTVANYPLTLQVAERRPIIVAGDADSSSPIDVDAIEGGVPASARRAIKVNATTPLGGMRPTN